LYCPHAASDIKNQFPDSKIIISLRNPIEITQSQYFSLQFMRFDTRSFSEILDSDEEQIARGEFYIDNLLQAGFYSKHIKRFQEVFSPDKIKIVIFEEYIKNIVPTINSILDFLGIDEPMNFDEQKKGAYRVPKNSIAKFMLENSTFRKTAQLLIPVVARQRIGDKFFAKESKKPPMSIKERERLKGIFEQDVKNLEQLLGRKFPWIDFN
jgi:hypothetical protein